VIGPKEHKRDANMRRLAAVLPEFVKKPFKSMREY
jgi:hypothetical protein